MQPRWDVRKRGIQLKGSRLTFNPDLVFNKVAAVGDIKYKLFGNEWNRPDIYQVLAFATAYTSHRCMLVRFRAPQSPALPSVVVGDKEVTAFSWTADARLQPEIEADRIAEGISLWLDK